MSVLPIYLYGSEVLRKKARPVPELDNSLIKLAYDMAETMHKANGIGLAATQVGDLRRIIVVDQSSVEEAEAEEESTDSKRPTNGQQRTLVLINPVVLLEEGSWSMEEGCLSIPEVRAAVRRPAAARVKFLDANFREVEMAAEGLLGRVILHEIDHLNGVLFVDLLSKTKRTLLRPALKKIKQGDVETSYPIVSAVEA